MQNLSLNHLNLFRSTELVRQKEVFVWPFFFWPQILRFVRPQCPRNQLVKIFLSFCIPASGIVVVHNNIWYYQNHMDIFFSPTHISIPLWLKGFFHNSDVLETSKALTLFGNIPNWKSTQLMSTICPLSTRLLRMSWMTTERSDLRSSINSDGAKPSWSEADP